METEGEGFLYGKDKERCLICLCHVHSWNICTQEPFIRNCLSWGVLVGASSAEGSDGRKGLHLIREGKHEGKNDCIHSCHALLSSCSLGWRGWQTCKQTLFNFWFGSSLSYSGHVPGLLGSWLLWAGGRPGGPAAGGARARCLCAEGWWG